MVPYRQFWYNGTVWDSDSGFSLRCGEMFGNGSIVTVAFLFDVERCLEMVRLPHGMLPGDL